MEVLGGTELSLDWLLIQLIQQNFVRKRLGQQLKAAKAVDTNSFYLEKIMDYTLCAHLRLCLVPLSRVKWARVSGSSADFL